MTEHTGRDGAGISYEKNGRNVTELRPRDGEVWSDVSLSCWKRSGGPGDLANVCELTVIAEPGMTPDNKVKKEFKSPDGAGLLYEKAGDKIARLTPRLGEVWSEVSLDCRKRAGGTNDRANVCKLTVIAEPEKNKH